MSLNTTRARIAPAALLALAASLTLALPLPAQERAPQFSTSVEWIRVQVGVYKDYQFVPGFTADDFELKIDDRPREVQWVVETDLTRDTITDGRPIPRHFVFVMDTIFHRPEKLEISKRAVRHFLDTMHRPGDVMALAAVGYNGVSLLQPFTGDPAVIARELEQLGTEWNWWVQRQMGGTYGEFGYEGMPIPRRKPPGIRPGHELIPGIVPEYRVDVVNLVGQYLAGLDRLAVGLQAIEGRKHLLLYGPGVGSGMVGMADAAPVTPRAPARLVEHVADRDYWAFDLRSLMERMASSMRDADTAIHAMSTSRAPTSLRRGRFGSTSLWYLAEETRGSRQFKTHHLEGPTERINALTEKYYTLAYRREAADSERVTVEVSVNRTDVVVEAPTRLVLPPEPARMTELQRRLARSERIALEAQPAPERVEPPSSAPRNQPSRSPRK